MAFSRKNNRFRFSRRTFFIFLKELERLNLAVNEGKIIDANFVDIPQQRNKVSENEEIKEGKGNKRGELKKDNPKKKRQKDIDARWIKYEFNIQHVS
jgi:hypothetical protein